MASFLWGANGEEVTPEEIAQRREMAQALLQRGQEVPAYNWAQGAANMLNSFMGGFMQGRAMKAERANDDYNKAMVAALSGDGAFGGAGTDASDPQVNSYLGSDEAMKLAGPQDQSDPFAGTGTDAGNPVTRNTEAPSGISPVAHALLSPAQPTVGQAAQAGASNILAQGLIERIRRAESGGDANATNPNSSATGDFQFTNPTWTALRQQHPELGLTADGRTDPAQSQVAAKQLATDNLAYMLAHGVQSPTEGQAYLAHFAGAPTATNLVQADPNTPISQIMSPQQIAANPFLRNMTAGQVQDWAAQKMGGSGTPPAQAQQTQFAANNYTQAPDMAPPQAQAGPSMSALMGVLADPRANQQTRGMASALLQNQMQLQQDRQRYYMEQADPENVARRRYYDMEAARIAQQMSAPQKPAYSQIISGPQAQQIGLDPSKAYQQGPDGKWQQVGGSGVNVSINTGNGGVADATSKAYAEKHGALLAAQEDDAQKTGPTLLNLGKALENLAPQIGPGGAPGFIQNQFGKYMPDGWKPSGQSEREQFQSLVNDFIKQSHVPGEGEQSNADAARLAEMAPNMMNSVEGNIAISKTLQGLAQRKISLGALAGQEGRGEISSKDRAAAVDKLPDPYAPMKQYLAQNKSQPNQATPQSGARTTSSGVTWSVR